MRFTISWLREFLDTKASLKEITDTLTAIGLEVEKLTNPGDALADFKIAQIKTAEQHPDADRLKVCSVDTGSETLQIVCGAPNARPGIKVVLAPVGTLIPNGNFKIKASEIRGVKSNGMMCSEQELHLGNDSDGIIELDDNAPVGETYVTYAGLDDPVIEIAITPNRGDCLGVYGIARDLAAAGLGTLKPLHIKPLKSDEASPISVTIEGNTPCSMYIGRYFKGVKNGPSPKWLQQRLQAVDLQPISTLVDITNYIALSFGRPLHVFDADKLHGNVVIRKAKQGEKIKALDHKEYELDEGTMVIADQREVLAIAGIIGGENSGCTEETTNVFLEVALFDPVAIASTGRKMDIITDSRYRFERKVDPEFIMDGAHVASQMIADLCGGEQSAMVLEGHEPQWQHSIHLDPKIVKKIGGIDISEEKILSILESLGFRSEKADDGIDIAVPSWRQDVEGEADIVEEVMRIHGYDQIPLTPLPPLETLSTSVLLPHQKRLGTARRTLAKRGMNEVVTWSFMSGEKAKIFGGQSEGLTLHNPISMDLNVMRPTLIPNLVDAVYNNCCRANSDLSLFEVGPVFNDDAPERQHAVVAGIRSGFDRKKNHYKEQRAVDVFDAKLDALTVLEACGMPADNVQIKRGAPDWYHPGRSGVIAIGKTVLGYFGEIHPAIVEKYDIDVSVCGFELFISNVPPAKSKSSKARPKLELSEYQSVQRDFAFVVDEEVSASDVVKAIRAADKKLISNISIFDVYAGKGIDDGKKSLAVSVKLQPKDRTLTDEEIEAVSDKVIELAGKQTGATLR